MGKSYFTTHNLLLRFPWAAFFAPTKAILAQQEADYLNALPKPLPDLFWPAEFHTFHWAANNLEALKSFKLLVFDEVQWFGRFSFDAEMGLKMARLLQVLSRLRVPIVFLSATPGIADLVPAIFGIQERYIVSPQPFLQPQEIELVPNWGKASLFNQLSAYINQQAPRFQNNEQMLIYCENATYSTNYQNFSGLEILKPSSGVLGRVGVPIQRIFEDLQKAFPQYKISLCTAKSQEEFIDLAAGSLGDSDIVLTTSVLIQGVNLLSKKLTMLAAATDKIDDIVQFTARARVADFKLALFYDPWNLELAMESLPTVAELTIQPIPQEDFLRTWERLYQLRQVAAFSPDTVAQTFPFSPTSYFKPTERLPKPVAYSFRQLSNETPKAKAVAEDLRNNYQSFCGTKAQLVDWCYRARLFRDQIQLTKQIFVGDAHTRVSYKIKKILE